VFESLPALRVLDSCRLDLQPVQLLIGFGAKRDDPLRSQVTQHRQILVRVEPENLVLANFGQAGPSRRIDDILDQLKRDGSDT